MASVDDATQGAFLAGHADEVAPALGSTPDDLRASIDLPDELVARRVTAAEVARRAASALGGTVRWTEQGAVLDVDLLLGDVLADHAKRYIEFKGAEFTATIERALLARTTLVQRLFIDVVAYVDADGLHVRWRGGRGGYNWRPRVVVPAYRPHVLTVELRPPVRAAVPRPGAWLGELLAEMEWAVGT